MELQPAGVIPAAQTLVVYQGGVGGIIQGVEQVPGEGEVGGGVLTAAHQLHQGGGGGGVEHAGGRVEDCHPDLGAEIMSLFYK